MSYDLEARRLPPGADAAGFFEGDRDGIPLAPAELETLAAAVVAVDPQAERHDDDGWIEIDTPAMQVHLTHSESAITVPYWSTGVEAQAVMARAHEYAQVLTEHGLTVWDPQAGCVVGSGRAAPAAAAARFGHTTEAAIPGSSPVAERIVGWLIVVAGVTATAFVIYGFAYGFSGRSVEKAALVGVLVATVAVRPRRRRRPR